MPTALPGVNLSILREGAVSLWAAKQRSVLALIGIVVGVGSVIAMIAVGASAKSRAIAQFRELGTEVLGIQKVRARGREDRASIRLVDTEGLAEAAPSLVAAAPWIRSYGPFTHAGRPVGEGDILGVTAGFAELNKLRLAAGRFVSDLDVRRPYCVVGAEIAGAMSRNGARRVLGGSVKVLGSLCTVVGVLHPVAARGTRLFDANRSAFLPITTAQRTFADPEIRNIAARMQPGAHHETAAAEVRAHFRRTVAGLELEVTSARQLIAQMHRQMRLFTMLLAAVGSISLFVGGVGVMNVMLVSVTERRREIGIRRALGARRRDIQYQFLAESLILSLFGGVFGIALGVSAAAVICGLTGWPFDLSPATVVLGFGVATGVGVLSGFYPARQAARLDPITALRAD